MTRPRTIAIAASVAAIALLTPAAALAASETFFFEGSAQQFTVPTGVDKLTIVAIGAQGGSGSTGSTAPPSNGAQVVSTIEPVTPGETYTVLVGGDGFGSTIGAPNGSDGGGFNGGGGSNEQGGWGGGGASSVCAPGVSSCTNTNALVVAAGAGGVSGFNGGGAGGQVGGDGSPQSGDASVARGGNGATQSAGGAGGAAGTGVEATAGSPGSAGQGGNGALGPCAGGGGGGGLFGGGGGGTSSNGCGGGGGGSSAGPAGSTFTSGVAPGNLLGGGQITIFSEADTTSSSPSSASLTLGGSLTDGAQVSTDGGDGPPTGSVSFFACGPLTSAAGCASGGTEFDTGEPLNGTDNSPSVTSTSFTPTAAGTWCFRAEYSGDSNYPPSSDGSSDECFTVSKADTQTVSRPSPASITLGASGADSVTDGATVSGNAAGGSPTGTVSFFVCGPLAGASGCASTATPVGGAVSVGPGAGNTSSATSASFTPTQAGTWCFLAVYSGDGNYNGSRDGTGDECFTVAKADTSTASAPHDAGIALGASTTDGATVSGNADGGSPTGTVSFFLCGPLASALGCTSSADQIGSAVTVTAGAGDTATATSASFTPGALGTWCVLAVYSGDSNYNASRDSSVAECLTVSKASPGLSSRPQSATTTLSGGDRDLVTVSGNPVGGSPTGSVTFSVCGPLRSAAGCASAGKQVGGAVTLAKGSGNSATATSASFTPTAPGTWCFRATYPGNVNYTGASDGSARECFTVPTPAQPSVTIVSPKSGAVYTVGQTVRASYSCADSAGAPGLASCTGPVAAGAVVSTSKLGRQAFTVLATSKDGEQGTMTVQYRVIRPSNHHSVGDLKAHANGHVTFRVRVPGPGVVDVLVTNWKDNLGRVAKLLGPAKGRFVWGRARVVARRKSTLTVDVSPNKQALLVLAHPRYKVRLRVWVSFTPRHGRQRNLGFYGVPLTG